MRQNPSTISLAVGCEIDLGALQGRTMISHGNA